MMTENSKLTFRSFVNEQFSSATDFISHSINTLHINLNHSWPTTIALTVITCRFALFPVRLFAARNTMILRQAFMAAASRNMKYADIKASFQNPELWNSWMKECRGLGGHPMLSMLPLATHLPAFVFMSSSIRKLCDGCFMAGWAGTSPYMALSCVAMNAFILYKTDQWMTPKKEQTIEGNAKNQVTNQSTPSKTIYKAAHVINLFSLMIFNNMPSAMLLYILYSCGMSLAEVYVLHRVPIVKVFLLSTIRSNVKKVLSSSKIE